MEVSAKGGGRGRVCRMREVGGLVGRRVVNRLWVGRSFPKKNLGSGVGEKKVIKKLSPEKKNLAGKKRTRRKKKY
jgi:hypothetical protein